MDLRPTTHPVSGFLWVAGGWASLAFAFAGAILPVLPCTPFVILASFCFYRGSPRMHAWLHRSAWFGPMLDDWQQYRGVRRSMKYRALFLVTAVVACTLIYSNLTWWMQYVVLAGVSVGLYVILTCRTLPDDTPRAPRSA